MAFNTIQDVGAHISQRIGTMKELAAEDFAPEGGAADVVAKELMGGADMKFTQLRKFFGQVKRMERNYRGRDPATPLPMDDLYLLLPDLAYARGRGLITPDFYSLMRTCIAQAKMRTVADLRQFAKFLEAVIAYHKLREQERTDQPRVQRGGTRR